MTNEPNEIKPIAGDSASHKLRLALQMQHEGIQKKWQLLTDQYPEETTGQIEQRLSDWLAATPDADDPRFVIRRDYRRERSIGR